MGKMTKEQKQAVLDGISMVEDFVAIKHCVIGTDKRLLYAHNDRWEDVIDTLIEKIGAIETESDSPSKANETLLGIDKDIIAGSIEVYGETNQINVAIEEMSELTKELCKDLRSFRGFRREQIVEELTDVIIMLTDIILIYDIKSSEIEHWTERKLRRLRARMTESEEL